MRTEIDLNECEHFLKANLDQTDIDLNKSDFDLIMSVNTFSKQTWWWFVYIRDILFTITLITWWFVYICDTSFVTNAIKDKNAYILPLLPVIRAKNRKLSSYFRHHLGNCSTKEYHGAQMFDYLTFIRESLNLSRTSSIFLYYIYIYIFFFFNFYFNFNFYFYFFIILLFVKHLKLFLQ